MSDITNIVHITSDKNLVTEGDVTMSGGFYSFYYFFLTSNSELSASNGYDVVDGIEDELDLSIQNIEYATFSETTTAQKQAFEFIFGNNSDSYSVFFTDVVDNIQFSTNGQTADTAHINIGQVEWDSNGNGTADDNTTIAYTKNIYNPSESAPFDPNYAYSTTQPGSDSHSDIWLNSTAVTSGGNSWNSFAQGDYFFFNILHELGHALGLKHPFNVNGVSTPIDNQKYTVLSYDLLDGMGIVDADPSNDLYAYGLQLYDIAAIQEIYGSRNYTIRSNDTIYSAGNGNAFGVTEDNPFIYTIWDGDGVDEISASAYDDFVKIDLRQGEFSSIGKSVNPLFLSDRDGNGISTDVGLAKDNVAVAFHTVIENAVGTNDINNGDILIGNDWVNELRGLQGNDVLFGEGLVFDGSVGFTTVDVSDPNDPNQTKPSAALDNDILNPGVGADEAYGGFGDDEFIAAGQLDGLEGDLYHGGGYVGGPGIGSSEISFTLDGKDTVNYSSLGYGITVDLTSQSNGLAFRTEGGVQTQDSLRSIESIIGTSFDDIFKPTEGVANMFTGGSGTDSVDYTSYTGNVIVNLGTGTDSDGNVLIQIQKVVGSDSGTGDTLIGSANEDILDGGAGSDTLQAGDGDDVLLGRGESGALDGDSLDGGVGSDTADYSNVGFAVRASLTGGGNGSVVDVGLTGSSDVLTSIENITGSAFEDEIFGDSDDNVLIGKDGDDEIRGGAGNDTLDGGAGSDDLFGEAGDDHLIGGPGDDTGSLHGGIGNDTLEGGSGNDDLYGDEDNDDLDGGSGDDYLEGGLGDDTIDGGLGLDTYYYALGDGTDTITDSISLWAEDEILILDNGITWDGLLTGEDISFFGTSLRFGFQGESILFDDFLDGEAFSQDEIHFSDGQIVQWFRGKSNDPNQTGKEVVDGTNDDDLIIGGVDDNIINALGGDDYILSGPGADDIFAGSGNDVVFAGSDGDNIFGQSGDDIIFGGSDDDTISGGDGADYIEGDSGNDIIDGDGDNDVIDGDSGDDTISGGAGDDNLKGDVGNDTIYGDDGVDTINGGLGDDEVRGGTGDDVLDGGTGVDQLFGDEGDDTLIFRTDNTFGIGVTSTNTITGASFDLEGYNESFALYDGGDDVDTLRIQDDNRALFDDELDNIETVELASSNIFVNLTNAPSTADDITFTTDGLGVDGNVVWSSAGNDTLLGGSGSEEFFGGDGDDILDGGVAGDDLLDGGDGNDTISAVLSNGNASQLIGGAGNDTLNLLASGANYNRYTLNGGTGNDTYKIDFLDLEAATIFDDSGLSDELVWETNSGYYRPLVSTNIQRVGDDLEFYTVFTSGAEIEAFTIQDHYLVNNAVETLTFRDTFGLVQGDLSLDLSNISNWILGSVRGSQETLQGSDLADDVIWNNGAGGTSRDILSGGAGDDVLIAGDGAVSNDLGSHLLGGVGNDILIGGSENDILEGGAGDDVLQVGFSSLRQSIVYNPGDGNDTIIRGIGGGTTTTTNDTWVDFTGGIQNSDLSFNLVGDDFVVSLDASNSVTVSNALLISGQGIAGLTTVDGDTYVLNTGTSDVTATGRLNDNNIFISNSGDNNLVGGNSSDKYFYVGGLDTVSEANGIDSIHFQAGVSFSNLSFVNSGVEDLRIIVNAGADEITILGQRGSDTSKHVEELIFDDGTTVALSGVGSDASDLLIGTVNDDILFGLEGDDTLQGGAGNDSLDGGLGSDTADYTNASAAVTVDLIAGTATGGDGNDTLTSIENVTGSAFNDNITGDNVANTLLGLDGNDTINAGSGGDFVDGGAGNDTIRGAGGTDILIGGYGADDVRGESLGDTFYDVTDNLALIPTLDASLDGDDRFIDDTSGNATFYSQVGNNDMTGGSGDNIYHVWFHADGTNGSTIEINDSLGNDRLILESLDFNSLDYYWSFGANPNIPGSDGAFGDVTLHYTGTSTETQLYINNELGNVAADDTVTLAVDTFEFADGTIRNFLDLDFVIEGTGASETINGTAAANYIIAYNGDDTVNAGAGDDYVQGAFGNDTIYGEDGNDSLDGFDGDDTIFGGAGDDYIEGWTGDDILHGGDGNDVLSAFFGNDQLFGDAGDDELQGGGENDILDGGTGNDFLNGAGGDDIYIFSGGLDEFAGGGGNDTVSITGGATISDITISDFNNAGNDDALIVVNAGTDEIIVNNLRSTSTGQHLETIIFDDGFTTSLPDYNSWLVGTSGDDALTGTANDDTLVGKDGNDSLDGADGNDALHGGVGDDTLTGGLGDDQVYGGAGSDTASYASAASAVTVDLTAGTATGGDGNDTLNSIENVTGSAFADTLTGDAGNNTLRGGDGNDVLYGLDGDDQLFGEGGQDQLFGGQGNDYLEGLTQADILLNGDEGDDIILGGDGNDTINGGDDNDTLSGEIGNDTINGDAGDDIINGNEGGDTIDGGTGNDTVSGGAGADNISGGDGDDILSGDDSNDIINGGAGNDTLEGGAGGDTLDGGLGIDLATYANATSNVNVDLTAGTATGGAGADTLTNIENLTGSAFNDTLTGDANNNIIRGGDGNDFIYGLDGDDQLFGEGGQDRLFGGLGNDYLEGLTQADILLNGDEGDDTILGGDGNDTINGGADNDTIYGELGNDIINGDAGNDFIEGNEGGDTIDGGDGNDTIYGNDGGDTILGGDGDDMIFGGANNDNLTGGAGDDIVDGGTGNDTINGGLGNDTLIGGDGDDILESFEGDDIFQGGDGDDTYIIRVGSGNETIIDNSGNDKVLFGENIELSDLTYTQNGDDLTITTSTGETITIEDQFASGGTAVIENIELDDGTTVDVTEAAQNTAPIAADDDFAGDIDVQITGNLLADNGNGIDSDPDSDPISVIAGTFATALGGSVVVSANGDFTYTPAAGVSGLDSFSYTLEDDLGGQDTGSVTFNVQSVNVDPVAQDDSFTQDRDTVLTGNVFADNGNGVDSDANGDTLSVNPNTHITAQGGVVVLLANGDFTYTPPTAFVGADSFAYTLLDGNGGTDIAIVTFNVTAIAGDIEGTSGDDILNGTSGDDRLFGGDGDDVINGLNGADLIGGGIGNDTINGDAGDDTIYGGSGHDFLDGNGGVDVIYGQEGNDTIEGGANNDTLYGGNGNDTIDGNGGIDLIYGEAGEDIIEGGGSNDTIYGGSGNDTITGNGGQDDIYGDAGDDILTGGGGADTLHGGDDNDTITGNGGDDTLYGDAGNDNLTGGGGSDTIYGGSGNDTIIGNGGADQLFGEDGDDHITGGAGSEQILGGAGNDTIIGNGGNDTLDGGAGDDTITGNASADILYGRDGLDTLTGNGGSDTFMFEAATAFNDVDVITDFGVGSGTDVLDISDLLTGYDPLVDALTDFVQITDNGTDSTLSVDAGGGADNFVAIATLQNATGLTDEDALVASGELLVA